MVFLFVNRYSSGGTIHVPPLFNIQYVPQVLEVATENKKVAGNENPGPRKPFG
jgi:hypothetical protein